MLRRIARPLLGSVFVVDGLRTVLHPQEELANLPVLEQAVTDASEKAPLPLTPDLAVRGLGVAKIGAGVALGFGVAPRVAAATLVVLHIPTMLARHPFWAETGKARWDALGGLVRDAAILGGLLLAAGDTAGKPSLAWRADHARHDLTQAARKASTGTRAKVKREARKAQKAAKNVVVGAERDVQRLEAKVEKATKRKVKQAKRAAKHVERDLQLAVRKAEDAVEGAWERGEGAVKHAVGAVTGH